MLFSDITLLKATKGTKRFSVEVLIFLSSCTHVLLKKTSWNLCNNDLSLQDINIDMVDLLGDIGFNTRFSPKNTLT